MWTDKDPVPDPNTKWYGSQGTGFWSKFHIFLVKSYFLIRTRQIIWIEIHYTWFLLWSLNLLRVNCIFYFRFRCISINFEKIKILIFFFFFKSGLRSFPLERFCMILLDFTTQFPKFLHHLLLPEKKFKSKNLFFCI